MNRITTEPAAVKTAADLILDGGVRNSIVQYNYSHDNDGAGYLLAQFEGGRAFYNNVIRYNVSENDGQKNSYGGIHLWSTGANGGR